MKGNIKEIVTKFTPQTSVEEMLSYCDTVDDFNLLFEEFCKVQNKKLSVFLAYILRHNPSAAEIELDKNGWANVEDLIEGVARTGRKLDISMLEEIVSTDNKGRFSFNEDKTKIKANQGHSIDVDLQLEEKIPPEVLYHGTAEKYLESIKQKGIEKRNRNFVHLSLNEQTATAVGARHGKPVILKINTKQMVADGFKFYISENGVWLTEHVPFKYVMEIV